MSPALGVDALHRHYAFLRGVARRHLTPGGSELEPDDVVQEVVVRVLRRWSLLRFDDERALAGYLHRAVVNRARDARRLTPRWTSVDLDSLHSPRPSALDGLISSEWRRQTAAAVRDLREGDRKVILGRIVDALSFGELASRTGHSSPDAARKATTRALRRLRVRMAIAGS